MKQIAKELVTQIKTLTQQVTSVVDLNVIPHEKGSFFVNLYVGKKNVDQNKDHIYNQLYHVNSTGIKQLSKGTDTISNSFTSYSAPQNAIYYAKLQSIPDQDNKTKNNTILEIYCNKTQTIIHSVNLSKYHEDVLNNDVVGQPLQWNLAQDKLVYVAKQKAAEQKNFFQVDFEKDEEFETAKNYRKLQQDWGEQLTGIINTQLFIYDVTKSELSEVQVGEQLFHAYPQFDYQDRLIFQGYAAKEFKYGILHCFNRDSKIYRISQLNTKRVHPAQQNKDQQSQQLEQVTNQLQVISEDECCFRPSLSNQRNKLCYFGAPMKHQHVFALSLKLINLEQDAITEILPIVKENLIDQNARDNFSVRNRLYNGRFGFYDDYAKTFWLPDDTHFLFTSISAGQKGIFITNTESKQIVKISHLDNTQCETVSLLKYDQEQNYLFASVDGVAKPQQVGLLDLSHFKYNSAIEESLQQLQWRYIDVNPELIKDKLNEQFIYCNEAEGFLWYIEKKGVELKDCPLVVVIHGGPHAASLSQYSLLRQVLLERGKMLRNIIGYVLLVPNYTGSIGYGQDFLERLSGEIGTMTADEIMDMIVQVRQKGLCHPTKAIVYGGSYGGYMAGIMGSRYGEYFKGAVLLNPCLNLPFMFNITDIPDWINSSCLNQFHTWNLGNGEYKRLYDLSPASTPMTIPSLLLLGAKDQRVPHQAGIAFQAQQIANGKEIDTFIYPESDHRLADSLTTSLDVIMKSILFIDKHTQSD